VVVGTLATLALLMNAVRPRGHLRLTGVAALRTGVGRLYGLTRKLPRMNGWTRQKYV
jgi:hypothetical protein